MEVLRQAKQEFREIVKELVQTCRSEAVSPYIPSAKLSTYVCCLYVESKWRKHTEPACYKLNEGGIKEAGRHFGSKL